jgi:hypothetical protein
MAVDDDAAFTVSSTEDAICMAETTLGPDSLAALVLDAHLALPVAGAVPPDGVLHWHGLLVEALGDTDDALVLATRRTTGPPFVLEDELDRWRTMRARHDDCALELADWIVFVRDEVALSLAEIAGPPAVWS